MAKKKKIDIICCPYCKKELPKDFCKKPTVLKNEELYDFVEMEDIEFLELEDINFEELRNEIDIPEIDFEEFEKNFYEDINFKEFPCPDCPLKRK